MDSEKWRAGARDEDSDLVNGVVGWIERSIVFERCFWERKQEGWRDALIDGVFGDVD